MTLVTMSLFLISPLYCDESGICETALFNCLVDALIIAAGGFIAALFSGPGVIAAFVIDLIATTGYGTWCIEGYAFCKAYFV